MVRGATRGCSGVLLLLSFAGSGCSSSSLPDAHAKRDAGGAAATVMPAPDAARRDGAAGPREAGTTPSPDSGPPKTGPGSADADGSTHAKGTGRLVYVKASNPEAQDWFGSAVALAGERLAVGAWYEDSRATGIDGDQLDNSEDRSGAVYLFAKNGDAWAQQHYIKASNSGSGDGFGDALAFSETTLAVGAPYEDSAATGIDGDQGDAKGGNYGAVYVFAESAGAWKQEAYVKASNSDPVDLFGTSVALEGDLLVVGAPWEDGAGTGSEGDPQDNSAKDSGAVYVFSRTANGWAQTAYLKASSPKAGDHFGQAVALSGSVIAVGAPGDGSGAAGVDPAPSGGALANSGAVYLLEPAGASYRQAVYVKAASPAADAQFGSSIAFDGGTLVVGAVGEASPNGSGAPPSTASSESGAVYVFESDQGGKWAQRAFLKGSNVAAQQYFGFAVGLSADTLVVGATGEDNLSPGAGAAYLFLRTATGWRLDSRMTAPNAEKGDQFGWGVAISPSLLAVTAIGEASDSPGIDGGWSNNRAPVAGAAFLYVR